MLQRCCATCNLSNIGSQPALLPMQHDMFAETQTEVSCLKHGVQVSAELQVRLRGAPRNWAACQSHYLDIGFNTGCSGLAFYSGMYAHGHCASMVGKTRVNWIYHHARRQGFAGLAALASPEQFCYHAFEGNRRFTSTMQMMDAFWEGLGLPSAVYPETLFAGHDGHAPMHVDMVANSSWGSSMFKEKHWFEDDIKTKCPVRKQNMTGRPIFECQPPQRSNRTHARPSYQTTEVSTVSSSRFIRGLRSSSDGMIALKVSTLGSQ